MHDDLFNKSGSLEGTQYCMIEVKKFSNAQFYDFYHHFVNLVLCTVPCNIVRKP